MISDSEWKMHPVNILLQALGGAGAPSPPRPADNQSAWDLVTKISTLFDTLYGAIGIAGKNVRAVCDVIDMVSASPVTPTEYQITSDFNFEHLVLVLNPPKEFAVAAFRGVGVLVVDARNRVFRIYALDGPGVEERERYLVEEGTRGGLSLDE